MIGHEYCGLSLQGPDYCSPSINSSIFFYLPFALRQVAHSVSRKTREAILERAKVLDIKVLNAAAKMRTEENE